MKTHFLSLVGGLALLFSLSGTAQTLSPVDDAYTTDGTGASTTYGTTDPNRLIAKKNASAGYNRHTFFKFNISSVSSVGTAKLRAFAYLSGSSATPIVTEARSSTNTSWTESTLTWNNQPTLGSTVLASQGVSSTTGQYFEWDVSSYIAAEKAAGATFVTLVLTNPTNSTPATYFNSDEAASNRPQLLVTAATPTNIVTYAGGTGKEAFYDVVRLSNNTYLVAGVADDLNWISGSVPRTQLASTGINNGQGTNKIGFLLHLSSDLQTINRVVHFAANAVEDIRYIKTSNVPGATTGNIYISGNTKDTKVNNGGYFIARLNNNFVAGAPTALTWVRSIWAETGSYIQTGHPWDVGSDNKVVYLTGQTHGYDWAAAHRLNASGVQDVVPDWRTHWRTSGPEYRGTAATYPDAATDPLSYSGIVFKRAGRGDLRSWTQADYDLWTSDGNGGTKKGKWPLDILFSGPFNTTSPSDASPGYTGYKPSGTFVYGPSAIAIDRRDNHIYLGMNLKSVLPDGNPDFEPAVVAFDQNGGLKWWSRLYHEKTPAGTLVNSSPDQYVDGLDIDYTTTQANGATLVVNARCHGNNVENLWEGNTVDAVTGEFGFKNQFTGSNGNIHISWLGKLRLDNGQLRASSYVAEANEGNTSWGSPLADPNLDGWFDPNGGWTELNSTYLQRNSVKINEHGSVLIVGSGRRTITTTGAFQKMIKPAAGKSSWNAFVRAYKKDLNNLAYSSILTGTWDPATGVGGDNITLTNLFPVSNGIIAVGFHKEGTTAGVAAGNNIPTANIPAWGAASASGQSAVLAFFSGTNFYNPGGTYRQGKGSETASTQSTSQASTWDHDLRLYPNPAHEQVMVQFASVEGTVSDIYLLDAAGRIVLAEKASARQAAEGLRLSTQALPSGMYLLRISVGNEVITRRLSIAQH